MTLANDWLNQQVNCMVPSYPSSNAEVSLFPPATGRCTGMLWTIRGPLQAALPSQLLCSSGI